MDRGAILLSLLAFIAACSSTDTLKPEFDSREPAATLSEARKKALDEQIRFKDLRSSSKFGDNEIVILQVNDVYEVEPSEAGTRGGLARLAAIRAVLGEKVPKVSGALSQRVLTILPGDFLSPSAIGASREQDDGPTHKKGNFVAGRHMIAGLRAAGMDIVSFGNHEFDFKSKAAPKLPPQELRNRIAEFGAPRPLVDDKGRPLSVGTFSEPKWLAGNVVLNDTDPKSLPPSFEGSHQPYIWPTTVLVDKKPVKLQVGVLSICVPWPSDYVTFESAGVAGDVLVSAKRQIDWLKSNGANIIVAMTHQSMENDRKFAEVFKKDVHVIAGGHEHDRQSDSFVRGVKGQMPVLRVTKADANAKSAYIHRIAFNNDANGKIVPVASRSSWMEVDSTIPDVEFVRDITQEFELKAKASFRKEKLGKLPYAPDRVIWKTVNDLDGRESKIRSQKTLLSEIIGRSLVSKTYRLQKAATSLPPWVNPVIGGIYHGGTIRIDDRLMSPKTLSEVLSKRSYAEQENVCESPKNCVPTGDPRCEKKVRCPGDITEYDVLRIAPFPETVLTWVQMSGAQILTLYACNDFNAGTGSYLHFTNIFPCTEKRNALCYLKQNPFEDEFGPSSEEIQIDPKVDYTVASLDYLTHVALPKHKGVFKTAPPVFPAPDEHKNPLWISENDIRRVLVEEPTKNNWVGKVIQDREIEKSRGYGPQPKNEKPGKAPKKCIYQ